MKNVHFNINVTVNDDDWGYRDPKGNVDVRVTIPVVMFNEKSFSSLVMELVAEATSKYESAVRLAEIEESARALEAQEEVINDPEA